MSFALSRAVLLAAIASPLLIALGISVRPLRPVMLRLAPWAALPALALAAGFHQISQVELAWLLLDTTLYADDRLTRGFLLLTASLWLAAGWFTPAYLQHDRRRHRFWLFFLLTMAGNIGLVLAQDVASFYALFSLMTFAAYGTIVHEQTREAKRAAQTYFVLAFVGELALLSAFLMVVRGDVSLSLDAARLSVATAPDRTLLAVLLLVGFGIKAGAIPLHVWLPLAHPVAPTPASAVLSGAMIKAGLLGWLRFLPVGLVELHDLGWGCAMLGFLGALFGALVGATQHRPKTVLAYSSISQLGIMMIVVGVLLGSPQTLRASLSALAFFALHHALAKGSLFLGTAVAHATSRPWAGRLVALGLLLPALSIAGAPLSSGALGKIALHDALTQAGDAWQLFATLLSIAAIGSALIMIRFMVVAAPHTRPGGETPRPGLWLPWLVLVVCDVLILFASPVEKPSLSKLLKGDKLGSSTWPLVSGAAVATVAWMASRRMAGVWAVPDGDLLIPLEGLWRRLARKAAGLRGSAQPKLAALLDATKQARAKLRRAAEGVLREMEGAQRQLGRYNVIGTLLGVMLLVVVSLLMVSAPP